MPWPFMHKEAASCSQKSFLASLIRLVCCRAKTMKAVVKAKSETWSLAKRLRSHNSKSGRCAGHYPDFLDSVYGLFTTTFGAGLLTSSCALTFSIFAACSFS